MNIKKLTFTKLGTVKCDEFEYTYEDFFQLMYNSITRNIEENGVIYDEKNDSYKIMFGSTVYQAMLGKEKIGKNSDKEDVVKIISKLAELTKKQKEEFDIKEEKEEEKENLDTIIANGKKGVFNSDFAKKEYIKYLKSRLNSTDFIFDFFPLLDRLDYSASLIYYPELQRLLTGIGVILDVAFWIFALLIERASLTAVESLLMIGKTVLDTSSLVNHFVDEYNIVIPSTLTLLLRCIPTAIINGVIDVINFGYSLGSSLYDKIDMMLENRKIKKQIKAIEKSMVKSKKKINKEQGSIQKTKVEEKEIVKEENKVKNPIQQSIVDMAKEFKQLKEKILGISSQKKKEEYSKELLEILNYYKEISKSFEEKGNYLSVHRNILNQIMSLRFRVEETKKKEEETKKTDDEFQRLIDEVDSVSSKSASSK